MISVSESGEDVSGAPKWFLLFSEKLSDGGEVSVAYPFTLAKRVKRLEEGKEPREQFEPNGNGEGNVCVYFPAKKEHSRLRFHVHASFEADLSRSSIKDCKANDELLERLSDLSARSLFQVQKLGLLTRGFLEILPNGRDGLGDKYECFLCRIVAKMRENPLVPCLESGAMPGKRALMALRPPIRELLRLTRSEIFCDWMRASGHGSDRSKGDNGLSWMRSIFAGSAGSI